MPAIRIDAVEIKPQPVVTGAQYLLSVAVTEILPGILTTDEYYIETADGFCLTLEGGQYG